MGIVRNFFNLGKKTGKLGLIIICLFFIMPLSGFPTSSPPSIPEIPLPLLKDIKKANNTTAHDKMQDTETPHKGSNTITSIVPPSIKLEISPPKNEEQAFERIKDYKILRKIFPPASFNDNSIRKDLFGKYVNIVRPYLENEVETSEIEQSSNLFWIFHNQNNPLNFYKKPKYYKHNNRMFSIKNGSKRDKYISNPVVNVNKVSVINDEKIPSSRNKKFSFDIEYFSLKKTKIGTSFFLFTGIVIILCFSLCVSFAVLWKKKN